jgi:hypothetical protein
MYVMEALFRLLSATAHLVVLRGRVTFFDAMNEVD